MTDTYDETFKCEECERELDWSEYVHFSLDCEDADAHRCKMCHKAITQQRMWRTAFKGLLYWARWINHELSAGDDDE